MLNVLSGASSSMQNSLYPDWCVRRRVGALPWWRGRGAEMSLESGNSAVWIIKREDRAKPPACKSDKMLPLTEPSRCNVAMKAGYPSRGRALEPCYGECKSEATLPNINPCDGSIDSLYLCVYLGMHAFVCMCTCVRIVHVVHLICTEARSRQRCTCILSYLALSDVM